MKDIIIALIGIDSVKLGIVCIAIVGCFISGMAIAFRVEKVYEICVTCAAGITVVGGWLGHAQPPAQATGQDTGTSSIKVDGK